MKKLLITLVLVFSIGLVFGQKYTKTTTIKSGNETYQVVEVITKVEFDKIQKVEDVKKEKERLLRLSNEEARKVFEVEEEKMRKLLEEKKKKLTKPDKSHTLVK